MAKKKAKKKEIEIPELDKDPIYEEKIFSQMQGSVIQFTNVHNPKDIVLSGKAVLEANTPQGKVPVPYNFEFPKGITDYLEAFAKFKEILNAALAKDQATQAMGQQQKKLGGNNRLYGSG